MSGRPWLEALKDVVRERSTDTDEISEKTAEALPSHGCKRCKSPGDETTRGVDLRTAKKIHGSFKEEEQKLIAAGWKPKERCGKTIWKHPGNGFYFSQKMALHLLESKKSTEEKERA